MKMFYFSIRNISTFVVFGSDLDAAAKVLRVLLSVGKVMLLLAFLYMFICSLDTLSSAFQLIGGKHISLEPPFVSQGCVCIDRETTCYCEPRTNRSPCHFVSCWRRRMRYTGWGLPLERQKLFLPFVKWIQVKRQVTSSRTILFCPTLWLDWSLVF